MKHVEVDLFNLSNKNAFKKATVGNVVPTFSILLAQPKRFMFPCSSHEIPHAQILG